MFLLDQIAERRIEELTPGPDGQPILSVVSAGATPEEEAVGGADSPAPTGQPAE